MNSAPGGQYSLQNSAWGTVFTSENCLGGHFLGGAKFPMTTVLQDLLPELGPCMSLWKYAGAFTSPKGSQRYSNFPKVVMNAVLGILSASSGTWW